ncbi:von Willebrand factor A domain-containing protein 8 [Borealophlyctis nickersoniae]|nr:von Willebrand factor A domain-containing protein 8 [Borealophlyctis nickersoniae]
MLFRFPTTDLSHPPQELKNDVPEHVKKAAQEMAREALKKRLAEIKMSVPEMEAYHHTYEGVKREIQQLRVVLEGVQAREKERVWMRNQTDGELDDGKIVEGLTGESSVYKRRGTDQPEMGEQVKPKRLKFVFDVSASMYHFNGHDGRLARCLETALMVMESLDSLGTKYVYDIVGHSGDSECIELVKVHEPPKNELEKLKVLQTMTAHSQYCFSGDTTLAATKRAVKDVTEEEADDYFVVVISDANLRRYGISPVELGRALDSDERVNAVILFVGSLGEDAKFLTRALPPGKAFVALDTKDVPKIMQQVFAAAVSS